MTLPLTQVTAGSALSLGSALGIGVAFGFALERAGLGSARKIAAQFYGTDFAVFKMMFTAIMVAGAGTVVLASVGLLDMTRVEVPGTWLAAQLAGGVIFGVGMIVGGLCPGTSCVAAAAGRLDGLAVLAGMVGGTLLFAESFAAVRPLYEGGARGRFTLDQLLHVPGPVVVVAVTALALLGFRLAEWFERRASGAGAAPAATAEATA